MEILLEREEKTSKLTIGKVYIDGNFFGYSLEDVVRAKGIKIPEETAIDAGRYRVIWAWSPRFKIYTPRLVGVPGFLGVLIHVGNWVRDTEGCILMGLKRYSDGIGESQKATKWLYKTIEKEIDEGKAVYITVR